MQLIIGNRYNWKNQPERLVYMGTHRYRFDVRIWYQFAKVETPTKVWCEVLVDELEDFEETKDQQEVIVSNVSKFNIPVLDTDSELNWFLPVTGKQKAQWKQETYRGRRNRN